MAGRTGRQQVAGNLDRKYPSHETPAALGYIEGGHARGKVVITVQHAAE